MNVMLKVDYVVPVPSSGGISCYICEEPADGDPSVGIPEADAYTVVMGDGAFAMTLCARCIEVPA